MLVLVDLGLRLNKQEQNRAGRRRGKDQMSGKRMPGGMPEPGWTPQEHQQAVAQFREGIANGLNPQWPQPRESLMPDGRITPPGYVFVQPGQEQGAGRARADDLDR